MYRFEVYFIDECIGQFDTYEEAIDFVMSLPKKNHSIISVIDVKISSRCYYKIG